MKFDEFARAVEYYEKLSNYDSNYRPYLDFVQREWARPSLELAEGILDFLNKWGMRIHKTPDLLKDLTKALTDAQPYIKVFRGFQIENCDLQSTLRVADEQLRLQTATLYLFEIFYAVGRRFVDVATAKTLHLLAPTFFVIWDSTTQSRLTPRRGSFAWRYAMFYLPRVQRDLNLLIEEVMRQFGLSRQEAIIKLETLGKNRKALAKLADEYYFSRLTKGFSK